jgi:hypothetical protein
MPSLHPHYHFRIDARPISQIPVSVSSPVLAHWMDSGGAQSLHDHLFSSTDDVNRVYLDEIGNEEMTTCCATRLPNFGVLC